MSEDKDTEKSYWASVNQEALDAWEESEHDRDAAGEALERSCDGSYWVIYYHAARKCLQYSRNEDAIFEHMGDDALAGCDSMGMVHCRAAYFAFLQDCQGALQELVDAHDDEGDEDAQLGSDR